MKYEAKKNRQTISKESILSVAASSKIATCSLGFKLAAKIAKEYAGNKAFYDDFARFNFANRSSAEIPSEIVSFCRPPSEALAVINQVYARFRSLDTDQIFKLLGVVKTNTNRCSPVEYKWYLVYLRKYGKTWRKGNVVSCAEILS